MRLIVNTHTHTLVRVVGFLQQGATNPRGWRLRTKARHTQTQILCSALDYLSDTLHTIIHFFVGWCTSTAATTAAWRRTKKNTLWQAGSHDSTFLSVCLSPDPLDGCNLTSAPRDPAPPHGQRLTLIHQLASNCSIYTYLCMEIDWRANCWAS